MPDSSLGNVRGADSPICSAIGTRRLVAFTYGGHKRVVEPYTYGLLRDGRRALCGYQIRGGSGSGSPAGWRTFDGAKMRGLVMLPGHFPGSRKEYRRGDRAFARIFCEVNAA